MSKFVANNWKKLAQFYIDVFGCEPQYPERDLSGKWIDKLTKIENVKIRGIHLKLPGYEDAPTLEIFEYSKTQNQQRNNQINDYGFAHIAFHVDDVEETLNKLLEAGGQKYGDLIERHFESIGLLRVIYAKDIEGNIIEIQNWKKI